MHIGSAGLRRFLQANAQTGSGGKLEDIVQRELAYFLG